MMICYEGIDACGKSTQIKMLQEHATERNIPYDLFHYPNYESDTGQAILKLLKAPERDPLVLQALMAANRYENQWVISNARGKGRLVILDRYWLSGLVYGLSDKLCLHWLLRVHDRLIQPDCWIVLDIPVEESFKRRPVRDDAYEASEARMTFCRQQYKDVCDFIPDTTVIDGMRDPKDIHERVKRCLEPL